VVILSLHSASSRTRYRAFPLFAVAAAAAACVLAASPAAHADRYYVYYGPPAPPPPPPPREAYYEYEHPTALSLAADLEGAVPLNAPVLADGNSLQGGGGFKLRIGERIHVARGLHITPEGGYGFDHVWASDDIGNAYSWDMHRLFGGARLEFGHIVVPVFYAHVGYGWRTTGDPTVPAASGVAFDIGGALDLRLIPFFAVGAHIEYATIDSQPYTPEWMALGLHASLTL